jgi:hypothetical protein
MLLVMLRVKKMHMGMKQTRAITRNKGRIFSRCNNYEAFTAKGTESGTDLH